MLEPPPPTISKREEELSEVSFLNPPCPAPQVPVGGFQIINLDQWWTTKDGFCKSACAFRWAEVEIRRSRYGREWFGPKSIHRTSNLARISPLERSPLSRKAGNRVQYSMSSSPFLYNFFFGGGGVYNFFWGWLNHIIFRGRQVWLNSQCFLQRFPHPCCVCYLSSFFCPSKSY